ncbi:MAG TPA: discoidin domain-containing protein [Chthonomonadaceae bacterium]|nr:discoidin domain-containing protein [Chthonomonadaceae bacterium]
MSHGYLITLYNVLLLFCVAQAHNNIALHRPYTLTPPPNYSLTTDLEDSVQLTDGRYADANGRLWTHKSAVGWSRISPVTITVDLGRDMPISGASFNTAAGGGGVQWPASILVLTSLDQQNWHPVGDLVAASNAQNGPPPQQGYALYRFWTDQWHTHGRWVRFVVTGQGDFIFTDEVEIYQGTPQMLREPLSGRPVSNMSSLMLREAIARRLQTDKERLRQLAERASIPEAERSRLRRDLENTPAEAGEWPEGAPGSFRATLPLNTRHAQLLQAQARLWRAAGVPAFAAWVPASPYDPVPYLTDHPLPNPARNSASVALMQGVTRPVAVNLINGREQPVTVRVHIAGLPGGANPDYIQVRQAVWTDTRSGEAVAAALPEVRREGGVYSIMVPSGLLGQLWLNIHAGGSLPPGDYNGRIVLETEAGNSHEIVLHLYVAPVKFSRAEALHLGGWDYTDRERGEGVTPQNRDALIAALKEHLVDIPWGSPGLLTAGRYDAGGNMTAQPDTARFDDWLAHWQGASRYAIYVEAGETFEGARMGTPEFARKVSEWIRFWWRHAQERGLRAGQLALLLVDEPNSPARDQRFAAWAQVIKQTAPQVLLFEDPIWPDPRQMDPQVPALSDILCPNRIQWLESGPAFAQFYRDWQARGKRLGLYTASGLHAPRDPYAFYRLQAWQCFAIGAREEHFWSFTATGEAPSWNPYLAVRTPETPLYIASESVTTAKQMEAIREGVEDYATLAMLARAAARRRERAPQDPLAHEAEDLLTAGVRSVLPPSGEKDLAWESPKDRTAADHMQERALRLLARLQE